MPETFEYPVDRQMTRIELLRRVYNEQLDQLVRTEIDFTLFERLSLSNPNDKEAVQQRMKMQKSSETKKSLVDIIAGKITKEQKAQELDARKEPGASKNV